LETKPHPGIEGFMEAYAVIETGGKQYRVQQGDILDVELLDAEEGASVEFETLAVSDGSELTIGAPLVDGAKVTASVVQNLRGKKIYSFKKKRRKGYRRKIGHRQELTKIKVESITA
jgi:large subunit ribosomal protein L21